MTLEGRCWIIENIAIQLVWLWVSPEDCIPLPLAVLYGLKESKEKWWEMN